MLEVKSRRAAERERERETTVQKYIVLQRDLGTCMSILCRLLGHVWFCIFKVLFLAKAFHAVK